MSTIYNPWQYLENFTPGTLIRADEVNDRLQGVAASLEALAELINRRIVVLPEGYKGDNIMAAAGSAINSIIYIDPQGDLNTYSMTGFESDVAASKQSAISAGHSAQSATAAIQKVTQIEQNIENLRDETGQTAQEVAVWRKQILITADFVEQAKTDAQKASLLASQVRDEARGYKDQTQKIYDQIGNATQEAQESASQARTAAAAAERDRDVIAQDRGRTTQDRLAVEQRAQQVSANASEVSTAREQVAEDRGFVAKARQDTADDREAAREYATQVHTQWQSVSADKQSVSDDRQAVEDARQQVATNAQSVQEDRTAVAQDRHESKAARDKAKQYRDEAETFAGSFQVGTTAGTVAAGDDSRINNGQTAFSWGNHASAGYLTKVSWGAVTGKPSTFPPSSHSHGYADLPITVAQVSNWNTAYGWGNHASAGYAKTKADLGLEKVANVDQRDASNLDRGTVPDDRLPATATRWPTWTEVSNKPDVLTNTGVGLSVGGDRTLSMASFGRYNNSNAIIPRRSRMTSESIFTNSNLTKTIQSSDYDVGDIIIIQKIGLSGNLTLNSVGGHMRLPDGSIGTSHVLEKGAMALLYLTKYNSGGDWLLSITGVQT